MVILTTFTTVVKLLLFKEVRTSLISFLLELGSNLARLNVMGEFNAKFGSRMQPLLLFFLLMSTCWAQVAKPDGAEDEVSTDTTTSSTKSKPWFEVISIRGYAQIRYNRLFESNNKFNSRSTDRSIGDKQGFFLRRARLTFSGDVTQRVFIFVQPDYATQAATLDGNGEVRASQNTFQIRDAYFDYHLTLNKEWRLRTGISKVPFGFSNLQSSSSRAPFDRDDALNTGTPNERDTGIYLMYSPTEIKKRFAQLTVNHLKGTGDYGMLTLGVYNGQSLNRPEENNDLHRSIRLTYPFKLQSGQFIETSLQAYEGKFVTNGPNPSDDEDYYDQRSAASLVIYPQPLGFQAEYAMGNGPQYRISENKISNNKLKGGYAQLNYYFSSSDHFFFPYLRYQEYNGGRKFEPGSPSSRVSEWELGSEWHPDPAFELTAAFTMANRYLSSSTGKNIEAGSMLRLQAQFNY